MRFEGTLKYWNDERGFGFIEPDQGGDQIFVHVRAFVNREGRPQSGQRFTFETEPGLKGKKRAKNVLSRNAAEATVAWRKSPARRGTATLLVIPAFLVVHGIIALLWRPPVILAPFYAGASLVTFIAYAMDKSAALRREWRTPESTLHLLSLVGGWPGALLAQQFLRHKSIKASFQSVFWVTVGLNVAAFILLCSPLCRSVWGPAGRV